VSGRRGVLSDWFLVALCWLALVPNVWLLAAEPAAGVRRDLVLYADLVLTVLLALAGCWRWLRSAVGRRHLLHHWWEVPALFPFLAVDGDGVWRWAVWLVLAARVVRVVDRTDNVAGDRITAQLVRHFSDPIVDAVRKPVTVAVLDEVIDVIKTGDYAANVRQALDQNRAEIEAMVLELVRNDPTTGRLRRLPFHDDVVHLIADTVLRIAEGALDDPRTAELVRDVISVSAAQVRAAVRAG
jgi:hypothetical protein